MLALLFFCTATVAGMCGLAAVAPRAIPPTLATTAFIDCAALAVLLLTR